MLARNSSYPFPKEVPPQELIFPSASEALEHLLSHPETTVTFFPVLSKEELAKIDHVPQELRHEFGKVLAQTPDDGGFFVPDRIRGFQQIQDLLAPINERMHSILAGLESYAPWTPCFRLFGTEKTSQGLRLHEDAPVHSNQEFRVVLTALGGNQGDQTTLFLNQRGAHFWNGRKSFDDTVLHQLQPKLYPAPPGHAAIFRLGKQATVAGNRSQDGGRSMPAPS